MLAQSRPDSNPSKTMMAACDVQFDSVEYGNAVQAKSETIFADEANSCFTRLTEVCFSL